MLRPRTYNSTDIHYTHRMLPFSLGSALFSACSGQVVTRTGSYRPIMWFAWAVMVLGWGLMTQLDDTSSTYVHHFFEPHLGAYREIKSREGPLPLRHLVGDRLSIPGTLTSHLVAHDLFRIIIFAAQTPLIGLQAAMPLKDMATSTATYGFLRYARRLAA